MKAITVSPQSKILNELMKKARRRSLILKSADGEHFVLARVTNLQGFYVGASDNFENEVQTTRKNKRLMKFLDERATKARGQKGVPIAEVRKQLGLA